MIAMGMATAYDINLLLTMLCLFGLGVAAVCKFGGAAAQSSQSGAPAPGFGG